VKCPRCQSQNREGVRFCEECGGRLVTSCASCGAELLPDKKFCGSCGSPATPEPVERQPSTQAYTPKHLAEKILTSRHALEGERKQVTVLFADLKGSMELLADRDPEDARKILDPVLERMMAAVHRYEGTVNQVMGEASWRCSLLERPTIEQFGAGVSLPSIVRRSPLSRLSQEYSKHIAEAGNLRRLLGL